MFDTTHCFDEGTHACRILDPCRGFDATGYIHRKRAHATDRFGDVARIEAAGQNQGLGHLRSLRPVKSCASATLLAPSVTFTENIWRQFRPAYISDLENLRIMRISVLVFAIATLSRDLANPVPLAIAGTAVSALLGATSWSQAASAREFGDQTQMLNLPLAPVVYFMSAMLFVNALVQIGLLWSDLRGEGADV